ncbi:type IX secretion system protein PorQ [Pseudochryseolinea flava]|uniref:type IX secretion system protein PorQ n=1 Tax=Pseudochryseolinea flava TaxID=2059302 RepID=UPI0014025AF3|nr:type IX secretion system protein PorQ [Pseudochryseolinea flava]
MRKTLFFVLLQLGSLTVFAQIGGQKSFEFLNVPNHGRLAGLGGVNVSHRDKDLNLLFSNPSLAGDTLAGIGTASYMFYVADVGEATFAYAHRFRKIGMLSFGVQHLGYGTITSYDATGVELGDFKSSETALVISKSHLVSSFRLGANLKMVFSNIAGYRASGVLFDLGGCFIHPHKDLTVGLVIKNFGFVSSDYTAQDRPSLPFDVQIGTTFKPEHMPIRFSLTAYNLDEDDVTYYNASSDMDKPRALDKVLRRFNFGAEILIHRKFNVLLGYNYLVHQELKLENGGGIAGVTFGFSLQIKSFDFVFSRNGYVVGNAGYGFTLSKNIDSIIKRKL